ncbi:MAG: tetratricopeptide repeat protein [Bacteroidia bacterium]|nr:tetratricopeptide repeat protein [Bacteroidia bacterium]
MLKTDKQDTVKLTHLNLIGFLYINMGEYDKSPIYITNALELGNKISNETKTNSPSIYKSAERGIGAAYYNKGIYNYYKSKYNEAIVSLDSGIIHLEAGEYKGGVARSLLQIGGMYYFLGNYSKAIQYYINSSKNFEKLGEKRSIADVNTNIGAIFQMQKNLPKALDYYKNALEQYKDVEFKLGVGMSLMNIGNVLKEKGDYKMALENLTNALKNQKEINFKKGIAECHSGLGDLYRVQKKYDESLENYFSALNIFDTLRDKEGQAFCYSYIGNVYLAQGAIKKAIDYSNKSLALANEIGLKDMEKDAYHLLADSYAAINDYKMAFDFHKKYTEIKDTLFNKDNNKKIAEMDAMYGAEKKEQELKLIKTQQDKEREVAAAESNRQKLFLLLIAAVAIAVAIIAGIIFRSLKVTKNQNQIIELQKNEVLLQKEIVEEHQKEIIDSITYAKRLQDAILPPIALIKTHLPDSFILFKPKAIVAGDFYWMETSVATGSHNGKEEELLFIAAADCTGHGVPGAMVSVVCSNALNRAVKEFKLVDTGKILDKTRDLVIETFERSHSEVKDGMDISLLCINKSKKQVSWSGANNPLWYIGSNNKNGNSENEFIEIKPDKQPIGKTEFPKPFTTHKVDYQENSTFYLFTDGFSDQFGGPKGKKFKYKQLAELLTKNNNLSQQQQADIVEKAFIEWKGELEQVDDVCIIGIKL